MSRNRQGSYDAAEILLRNIWYSIKALGSAHPRFAAIYSRFADQHLYGIPPILVPVLQYLGSYSPAGHCTITGHANLCSSDTSGSLEPGVREVAFRMAFDASHRTRKFDDHWTFPCACEGSQFYRTDERPVC